MKDKETDVIGGNGQPYLIVYQCLESRTRICTRTMYKVQLWAKNIGQVRVQANFKIPITGYYTAIAFLQES